MGRRNSGGSTTMALGQKGIFRGQDTWCCPHQVFNYTKANCLYHSSRHQFLYLVAGLMGRFVGDGDADGTRRYSTGSKHPVGKLIKQV